MAQLKTDRSFRISLPAGSARGVTIHTWTHGKVYGLVADPAAPHGFRLVGEARTHAVLVTKLQVQFLRDGCL